MNDNWKVVCERELAFDSPDHLVPHGTMQDNSTSLEFIKETEMRLGKNLYHMDLGCSGGQLVVDMNTRGHHSLGLEGSDYSRKHSRANWPEWDQKALFTCDISRPFEVFSDNDLVKFDIITAWEVLEHIKEEDLPGLFKRIHRQLKPTGLFVCTICPVPWIIEGVDLHQCCLPWEWWEKQLGCFFKSTDAYTNYVRINTPYSLTLCRKNWIDDD